MMPSLGSNWRSEMPKGGNRPARVSRGSVFEDLGFSPDEAAILRMKTQLHLELMWAIEKQGLSPRQLEKSDRRVPAAG